MILILQKLHTKLCCVTLLLDAHLVALEVFKHTTRYVIGPIIMIKSEST